MNTSLCISTNLLTLHNRTNKVVHGVRSMKKNSQEQVEFTHPGFREYHNIKTPQYNNVNTTIQNRLTAECMYLPKPIYVHTYQILFR